MKKTFRRFAFTLIELLVVIAIVGILAALTMPALLGARNRAFESECSNNLGQIGKALANYTQTENKNTPTGGPTVADVYKHSAPALVNTLNDFGVETNSMAWFCKRQIKFLKTDAATFRKGGTGSRISYFYWAWSTNGAGAGVDFLGLKSAWPAATWATNKLKGAVFASCPFYSATVAPPSDLSVTVTVESQFHLATDTEAPFREAGTPVLITGGAVQKIGPKQ